MPSAQSDFAHKICNICFFAANTHSPFICCTVCVVGLSEPRPENTPLPHHLGVFDKIQALIDEPHAAMHLTPMAGEAMVELEKEGITFFSRSEHMAEEASKAGCAIVAWCAKDSWTVVSSTKQLSSCSPRPSCYGITKRVSHTAPLTRLLPSATTC